MVACPRRGQSEKAVRLSTSRFTPRDAKKFFSLTLVGAESGCFQQQVTRAPASCTVSWINFAGLAGLIAATLVLPRFNLPLIIVVLISLTVPAVIIVLFEALFIKSRILFRPI